MTVARMLCKSPPTDRQRTQWEGLERLPVSMTSGALRHAGTLEQGSPNPVVARFSRPPDRVFKRYRIVEEQDLQAAVRVLNQTRKVAETRPGHEMDRLDDECVPTSFSGPTIIVT